MSASPSRWHRLRLGLSTLIGLRPAGFFIPYRYAGEVRPIGYPAIERLLAASLPHMELWLDQIEALGTHLRSFAGPPPLPRWNQDWFPRLDGAALYTAVRTGRPRRVLEIGSGHSTRFIARALADGAFACSLTCIDPKPRANLSRLHLDLQQRMFAPSDAALAGELRAGDILVVDSSHVAMPGSDVDLLLNEVLPGLAPGVLVHLHDIFLPDPYPASWTWRGYNEQVAMAPLLHGGGYAIRFASHYLVTRHWRRLERGIVGQLPLLPGAHESSLWLEKLPAAPTS